MDDWLVVITLSIAMLVGCYLAGCIPLAFSFSEDKLKLLTIFGAGLLIGTALAIIIPEGISTIYIESPSNSHFEHSEPVIAPAEGVVIRKLRAVVENSNNVVLPAVAKPVTTIHHHHEGEASHDLKESAVHQSEHSHDGHSHSDSRSGKHKIIGVSLVAGFVFMLIVDQLGGAHSHGGASAAAATDVETSSVHSHSRNRFTATLGLCVHAAADGIALGAATSVSQTGLTIIVFIAIMLHKAPAAFGLVSFLLHDGLDRARIRKHLFLFSAAAPIGAILTFFVLNHQNKEALAYYNATGIAMLFSAGTFLYVSAVHILPEVSSKSSRTISNDGTVIIREHKGFTKLELLAVIAGSLMPVGISLGHNHSH